MKSLEDLAQTNTARHSKDLAGAALYFLKAGGSMHQAAEMAQLASPRIGAVLKAAVEAGNITGWASNLVGSEAAIGFLQHLRGVSVFDSMLPSSAPVPLSFGNLYHATIVSTGSTVGPGFAAPVGRATFNTADMQKFKTQLIFVTTKEVLNGIEREAVRMIEEALREAVVMGVDRAFLQLLAQGVTPVASVGDGPSNFAADVRAAAERLTINASLRLFLIVPSRALRRLTLRTDTAGGDPFPTLSITSGTWKGIKIVPSDHLPASPGSPAFGLAMLVDASGVAMAAEALAIALSREADVSLDNLPTGFGGGTVGSPPVHATMTSLWQTDSIGLRCTRHWGAAKVRSGCVALISGMES